jgi:hypothetical protein
MTTVFLCHSGKDKEPVRCIANILQKSGISTWLDDNEIGLGENFVVKISEGLARSDYILVFLSEHFIQSKWVEHEWSVIFRQEVSHADSKIIPILIGDLPSKLPPAIALLTTRRYVDLRDPEDAAQHNLLIRHLTDRGPSLRGTVNTSDETHFGDVRVRPSRTKDGLILLEYEVGEHILSTQAHPAGIAKFMSMWFKDTHARILHRFGSDVIIKVENMAAHISKFLLPSLVRQYLEEGRVRRIQVLAAKSDPCLPWELLHTGETFVSLKVPIITTPPPLASKALPPLQPKCIIVMESQPDLYGVRMEKLLNSYFLKVNTGQATVRRIQVSSRQDLFCMPTQDDYDVLHIACHTISDATVDGSSKLTP